MQIIFATWRNSWSFPMITREWLNYVQDSMLLIHFDFRSGVVVFCLFQSSHWAILSIVSKMSNEESLTFPLSLASNIRARKKRKTKSFSSCEYSERQKRERLQIAFILFYRRQMTSIEFFTAFCLYEMRMSARKIRASSSDAQLSHVVFHLVHISNVLMDEMKRPTSSCFRTHHFSHESVRKEELQ